ncbi:TPA: hypothetical protein P7W98_004613 [Escherichia coli]|jgi:hypothetical protein|uniref:hypothetical protein n=2 Tax=Escherichia coli TaxID=562 RepID=UPI0012EF0DD6|nr:hypothetical protein [Escherichia coli]ECR8001667.1 hypothetical protein [Salmonella enterica]EHR2736255.1 hypothetical protein [Salmonella enterica]EIR9723110.1 hypothetical protein [Salmonella enterica]EJB7845547.1 hypothetical protein [Salmonella enterica]EJX2243633.1 hypothetical protein [Salmonella enterica]
MAFDNSHLADPGLFWRAVSAAGAPVDREDWLRLCSGIACWASLCGEDGLAAIEAWSARHNRGEAKHRSQYRHFLKLKGITNPEAMAQVFLQFSGVEWNRQASVQSDADRAERLRLSREATAKAKAERDKKGDAAARAAVKLLAKGGDPASTPYWRKKTALAAAGGVQLPALSTDLGVGGMFRSFNPRAYWSDCLLIPVYKFDAARQLYVDGLEAICGRCSAEGFQLTGSKFSPAGTRKQGGFYPMPGFMKVLDTSPHAPYSPLFVCEGFATAVALHHLSRGKVAVCAAFSIAGFGSCVASLRRFWPDADVMLVPDHGEAYRLAHKAAYGDEREPVPTIPGAAVVSFDGLDRFTPRDNLDWFDVLVEEGEDRARDLLRHAVRHARLERG